jgi:hypothetical protein
MKQHNKLFKLRTQMIEPVSAKEGKRITGGKAQGSIPGAYMIV